MTKERGGKPEVESIEFRPAEGPALISTTRTKYKRGGQGGGPSHDYESEEAVHTSLEDAHEHLNEHFGGHFGKKSAKKEEASKHEPAQEPEEEAGEPEEE